MGVVSQDMPGTYRQEGGREGRKEARRGTGMATVPVLQHCDLILNIRYWSTTFVTGQKLDNWALRACTVIFHKLLIQNPLFLSYGTAPIYTKFLKEVRVNYDIKIHLLVSSSCHPLRLWLPLTAQRAKVKQKLKLLSKYPAWEFLSICSYLVVVW